MHYSPDIFIFIPDTQGHIGLAIPTESPSSPWASPSLRSPSFCFPETGTQSPCCPGSALTLTHSLPSWESAEGGDARHLECGRLRGGEMGGQVLVPLPPPHTPKKHGSQGAGEKNKPPAMCRQIGQIVWGVGNERRGATEQARMGQEAKRRGKEKGPCPAKCQGVNLSKIKYSHP